MESFFLYVAKASGLLTVFFLAYYFLLRKETFFNANRWYLILGLFTSALLPLYTFTKIIYVDPQPQNYIEYDTLHPIPVQEPAPTDWSLVITCLYAVISLFLFIRIVINLASVVRLLYQKEKLKKETYSIVNLTENLAPFSFFNYIAVNPDLYTDDELESILLHEKVHSREKHSADILVANLFCVLFWFNPFMWWYKKAIVQNLEYIADQKAIQYCENKTNYQKALLRVVTNQNYLSITNHFNQSLIKKRIVMLNTSQSKKQNSLKYLLIIPILICFVAFFQMRVIAQERITPNSINQSLDAMKVRLEINKNTTDAEMKREKEVFKKEFDTDLKFSKVKRNSNGEITSIKVDLKAGKGKSETYQFSGSEPIKPFVVYATKDKNGLVSIGYGNSSTKKVFSNDVKTIVINGDDEEFDFSFDFPEAPDAPDFPDGNAEIEPLAPTHPFSSEKKIFIKKGKDGKGRTTVIVDGEVVIDSDEIIAEIDTDMLNNLNYSFSWNDSENNELSSDKIRIIKKEAIEKAKIELEKVKPELEKARVQILKSFEDMKSSQSNLEHSRREIELAKQELERARVELEKARKELEATKQKKQ